MHATRIARAALAAALALAWTLPARASGLYFTERGVRPLSRGGAFVAGADDAGSISYNPAGLAEAGDTFLLDASWLNHHASFTRQSRVVDSGGTVRTYQFPEVRSSTPFLPIPTIAATFGVGTPRAGETLSPWTVAIGVQAPYTAITSFPLAEEGQPAPSRYSLVSLDGSLLSILGGYLAYKPSDDFAIGAGVSALVGTFQSTVVFNTNPADRLIGAPEDPTYDSLSQLRVGPIIAPSGTLGVIWRPHPRVRLGASGALPYWVNAPATVNVRLPQAAPFDRASQNGQDAHVSFRLPPTVKAGIEVRPTDRLRIEAAYTREFWSVHDSIDITPDNVALVGVTGFPSPFPIGKISLPRNFQDTSIFHLGGEYRIDWQGYRFDQHVGVSYAQSAIPQDYLSPLTIDMDKVTVALGDSLHIGKHWRFDVTYAHVFTSPVDVDPASAKIGKVNPVAGNPTPLEAINGGRYSATADVLGAGLVYNF